MVAVVLFAVAGGVLVFLGVRDWRPVYPRYSDVLFVGLGACLIANAALCLAVPGSCAGPLVGRGERSRGRSTPTYLALTEGREGRPMSWPPAAAGWTPANGPEPGVC